jgi:hypothetical protein
MKKLLLLGALALGLIAPAFSQTLPRPGSLTGTEQLKSTCNNGSGCNIIFNHVRNTAGYLLVPTGTTVNSTPNWYASQLIATGAITTWNITLPNPAPDGMQFSITNGTGSAFTTNTTVTAPAGGNQAQTLNATFAGQTLASFGSASWQFTCTVVTNCSAGTWYRIQ